MGVLDWFGGRRDTPTTLDIGFEVKANPVADIIVSGIWGSGTDIFPKKSPSTQASEGYLQNITVFDCVNLISRSAAGVPWILMERGKTTTSKAHRKMSFKTAAKAMANGGLFAKASVHNSEIEDHPLLRLMERANPSQGGPEYIESVFGYWLITGNSYETWVGPSTGPNKGKPTELWALRPDRMNVIGGTKDSGEMVSGYRYYAGTLEDFFAPEEILHQKFFSPLDDFYGLSPIQVASRVIDGDNKALLWNQQILSNSGVPPGMVVIKNGVQKEVRDRLKAEMEKRFSGSSNSRRPMVGEGDVDWKDFGRSAVDLDWMEGRKMNRREIARAYNVPPELIGDTDVQGYASKEQARKGLYTETVLPLLDRRRDNLNHRVTAAYGDNFYLDYDRDQIEALHEDTAKRYVGLKVADWLSVNEKRTATGYDENTDPKCNIPILLVPGLAAALKPGGTGLEAPHSTPQIPADGINLPSVPGVM